MDLTLIRAYCLSLPFVQETIKWENNLVFTVGAKMFCITNLEGEALMSLKVPPEQFDELVALPNIVGAPYLARAGWVQMQPGVALGRQAIYDLIANSYQLVWQKLPAKKRSAMTAAGK